MRRWKIWIRYTDIKEEEVQKEVVTALRSVGYSWTEVAKELSIPQWQLKNWRKKTGYHDPFLCDADVTDDTLYTLVAASAAGHPERGARFTQADLRQDG
jgi:hypothetical protein